MCFQWLRVHGLASRLVQHAQKLGSNTILDKLDNASTQVIKPGLEGQLHREFKGSLDNYKETIIRPNKQLIHKQ